MKEQRIQTVLEKMDKMGLSQMIVSDPIAIFYLTGHYVDPGERFNVLMLDAKDGCKLFMNSLFKDQGDHCIETFYHTDMDEPTDDISKFIKTSPLGVDKNLQAKFLLPIIKKGIAPDIVVSSTCVDEARAVKDMEERALMREASLVNDAAMAKFRSLLKEGITEKELADEMLGIYRSLGAQDFSFDPIVAFGKRNTVLGHHVPDDTPLREGDVVLLDVGCKKDWYCADMTRVFFYKHEPQGEIRKAYETARRATEAAEDICAPGVLFCDIDKAARDVVTEGGYGKNFTHRTGHFIGLEDHDFGDVSANNKTPAVPGNCFSIEPGVTIAGEISLYVEDIVMITEDGREVLNKFSHDIDVVE
ncbi:MAG: aminopeptidase P family protein [Anaerofustis stercorihominis]|nr:aminopeptidase P family protein [Anaerofustis stercorihominis]